MPTQLANDTLDLLQHEFMLPDAWKQSMGLRSDFVPAYRRYTDGLQKVYMNENVRKAVTADELFEEYWSADYTDMIISEMADRLKFQQVFASELNEITLEEGQESWLAAFMRLNDFNKLQGDLHYAALRDGEAFILVYYAPDPENPDSTRNAYPVASLNYAFDGTDGIIPVIRDDVMIAAFKVFMHGNQIRGTLYGMIEMADYVYDEEEWKPAAPIEGEIGTSPDGVYINPVVYFPHKRRGNAYSGQSEIHKVIPAQDLLNRQLYSMAATSESSAFPTTFVKGMPADNILANLVPGGMVSFDAATDPERVRNAEITRLPGADLSQYINQIFLTIDMIADISRTPIRTRSMANASGFAMEKHEERLFAKIQNAQVEFGASWADVIARANYIGQVFVPNFTQALVNPRVDWDEVEVRSNETILAQASAAYGIIGDLRFYLERVAGVFGLDEADIDLLVAGHEQRLQSSIMGVNQLSSNNVLQFAANESGVVGGQDGGG